MKRLDILLKQYEKERMEAKTPEQFRQVNQRLLQRIDQLPGEKTQTEKMIRALFAGMT